MWAVIPNLTRCEELYYFSSRANPFIYDPLDCIIQIHDRNTQRQIRYFCFVRKLAARAP